MCCLKESLRIAYKAHALGVYRVRNYLGLRRCVTCERYNEFHEWKGYICTEKFTLDAGTHLLENITGISI